MADGLFRFARGPRRSRERIGRGLPGLYWHFPVTREKPGAIVLARHGDPRMTNAYGAHVIVASQLFGPGQSIFLAVRLDVPLAVRVGAGLRRVLGARRRSRRPGEDPRRGSIRSS